MEYVIAAYTDVGVKKAVNQDSLCVRRAVIPDVGETVLAVVCDGMGGLAMGELASATVVNAFGRWFDRHLPILPTICGSDFSQIRAQWLVLIDECHHAMLDYSAANCVQLGTTVSTFFAYSDHYITLTIGDSRIYERTGRLTQLTQDQSLVAREIVAGRISEEESRHHPQRNVLLQCVGIGGEIVPAFTEGRVRHDALYLLCSDGFVHELSPEEMGNRLQATLLNSKDDLTHALCDLTELCKGRGETDNITAVLVKASESKRPVKLFPLKNLRTRFRGQKDSTQKEELVETAQIVHTQEAIGLD